MLMNNLDPEVAENPDELVVYGGTGRAARSWEAFDAIVAIAARAGRRRDPAGPVGQARRCLPHPRVVAAGPDRQLEPGRRLGQLGRVPPPRGGGADDVRPDDRRVLDLHREPGDRPGHLRVLRGDRPSPLRRIAGGDDLVDGRPRRHGRSAAAGDHDERRRRTLPRGRPDHLRRRIETGYLDEEADDLEDAIARCQAAKGERRPLSVGLVANAADALPELQRMGFEADIVTDQTSAHDPLNGYVPNLMSLEEALRLRAENPDEYVRRSRAAIAAHCAAMVGFLDAGAEVFDYGNSLRAEARAGRVRAGLRLPRLRPRLHPPAVLRRQGPVPLGRPLRRPGGHRRHRPRGARGDPRRRAAAALDRAGRGEDRLPGPARRGSAGPATASGHGSACASTSWCDPARSRRRS